MANMEERSGQSLNAGNEVTANGGQQADYGGMDQHLDQVDLARASEAGSDPPGGLGTDIGGGNRDIGEDEAAAKD